MSNSLALMIASEPIKYRRSHAAAMSVDSDQKPRAARSRSQHGERIGRASDVHNWGKCKGNINQQPYNNTL